MEKGRSINITILFIFFAIMLLIANVHAMYINEPYISARQFACNPAFGFYVPGENVRLEVNASPPSGGYTVEFIIKKFDLIHGTWLTYEYPAEYDENKGVWFYSGEIPNIPYYIEGDFILEAVIKNSTSESLNTTVIRIEHPVELLKFNMSKKTLNYGETNEFLVVVKNKAYTNDTTCLGYHLGLNVTIEYEIVDRMGRIRNYTTELRPIKPNTTEFFKFNWSTYNAQIDQNHTIAIRINYENVYLEIGNSKGSSVYGADKAFQDNNTLIYNFTKTFYINPISVDIKAFYKNIEVESVPNKTGENVTIRPYVNNIGFYNVTMNITVNIYKYNNSGIFYIGNVTWINSTAERRYGIPKLTIFEGKNFSLHGDAKNYTLEVNVTYINPDPEANQSLVSFTLNKTLLVYSYVKPADMRIEINRFDYSVEDFSENDIYKRKSTFSVNYSIENLGSSKEGNLTVEIRSCKLLKSQNGTFLVGNCVYVVNYTKPVTVNQGNFTDKVILYKEEINPKVIYDSDVFIVKLNFSFENYTLLDERSYKNLFIDFESYPAELNLSKNYISLYVRNYTKIVNDNDYTPESGYNLEYLVWDSEGRVIAEGDLKDLGGLYYSEISFNKEIPAEEGFVYLKIKEKNGKFWKHLRLFFDHPISADVSTDKLSYYLGETANISVLISNPTDESLWLEKLTLKVLKQGKELFLPLNISLNKFIANGTSERIEVPWEVLNLINGTQGYNDVVVEIKYQNLTSGKSAVTESTERIWIWEAGIVNISSPKYVKIDEDFNVTVSLQSLTNVTGNLTLSFCGSSWTKNVEVDYYKEVSFNVSCSEAGNKVIKAWFEFGAFRNSTKTTSVHVNNIIVNLLTLNETGVDNEFFLSERLTALAEVRYANGTPLNNTSVKFYLDSDVYENFTNSSGVAKITVILNETGSLRVRAEVSSGIYYGANETTITVRSPVEVLVRTDRSRYEPGDTVNINATIRNIAPFAVKIDRSEISGIYWQGYLAQRYDE